LRRQEAGIRGAQGSKRPMLRALRQGVRSGDRHGRNGDLDSGRRLNGAP
jgi:hypothetical protein